MQITDIAVRPPVRNWMLSQVCSRKYNSRESDVFIRLVAREIKDGYGYDPYEYINWRKREYVLARQLFFYYLWKYTKKTLDHIGGLLDKNHATVIHSIRTIENLIETDRKFREMYQTLTQKIKKL